MGDSYNFEPRQKQGKGVAELSGWFAITPQQLAFNHGSMESMFVASSNKCSLSTWLGGGLVYCHRMQLVQCTYP